VGYLNVFKLGRRVFELIMFDVGDSRDDGIGVIVDSNIVFGRDLIDLNGSVAMNGETASSREVSTYILQGRLLFIHGRCGVKVQQ
jgi:hypothetical protein